MGRTFLLNALQFQALQFQASAYYDCLAPKLLLPLVQGAYSGGVQHLWLVFEPVSAFRGWHRLSTELVSFYVIT